MSEEERISSIPALKEEGNSLYKTGDHQGAGKKYSEALGRLEQLMLRYVVFVSPGLKQINLTSSVQASLMQHDVFLFVV